MLPSLLYPNSSPTPEMPYLTDEAYSDLNVGILVSTMAGDDKFMRTSCEQVLRRLPAYTPEGVHFRQQIVSDAISHTAAMQSLYQLARACLREYDQYQKDNQPTYARFESMAIRLNIASASMRILFRTIREILKLTAHHALGFASEGMRNWLQAFHAFFDEPFLREADKQQEGLMRISEGVRLSISARFGKGLKGTAYIIRDIHDSNKSKRNRRIKPGPQVVPLHSNRALSQAIGLRDGALQKVFRIVLAINEATYASIQALAFELSFYLGAARLHGVLHARGVPLCMPDPLEMTAKSIDYANLSDVSLALTNGEIPVGNELTQSDVQLILVTGANQGGKSTFLRSFGLAQLMMQGGLYVTAGHFRAGLASRLFTHFCRPEDRHMFSGKLDEELARMNGIISNLTPEALVLMNESFSSTTEMEGSAIAQQITTALHELGIRVVFVTHLFSYAQDVWIKRWPRTAFLTADRQKDGARTYKLLSGEPRSTSFGMDLFHQIIC